MKMENTNLINSILYLSKNIQLLYDKLYELEKDGKKDTFEYQKQLNYLKTTTEIETDAYRDKRFNYKMCEDCIKYIYNIKLRRYNINEIDELVNFKYEDAYIIRTLNNIRRKQRQYINENKDLNEDLKKFTKNIDLEDMNFIISKSLYLNTQIMEKFDLDLYNCFMCYLNDTMQNENNFLMKDGLLKAKYYTSLYNKVIESNLIYNNFEVEDKFYVSSKLTADMLNMPGELYEDLLQTYFTEPFINQGIKFAITENSTYEKPEEAIPLMLRYTFLRSTLQFLSDSQKKEIKESFNQLFEDQENNKYEKSKTLIESIFNLDKKDKQKVYTISFKQK